MRAECVLSGAQCVQLNEFDAHELFKEKFSRALVLTAKQIKSWWGNLKSKREKDNAEVHADSELVGEENDGWQMSMEQKTRANAAKELHDANEVGCRQGTDRYLYIYYAYNTLSQAMAEQIEELTQEHMPTDTNAPAAAASAAAAPSLGECDLRDFTKLIKQHYTGKELQKFYKEGFPNLVGGGMSLTDKALKLVRSKDPKCARFTQEFFEDSKNFAK